MVTIVRIDVVVTGSASSQNGTTALMLAADAGQTDVCEALISAGAAVNTQDKRVCTIFRRCVVMLSLTAAIALHATALGAIRSNGQLCCSLRAVVTLRHATL